MPPSGGENAILCSYSGYTVPPSERGKGHYVPPSGEEKGILSSYSGHYVPPSGEEKGKLS